MIWGHRVPASDQLLIPLVHHGEDVTTGTGIVRGEGHSETRRAALALPPTRWHPRGSVSE